MVTPRESLALTIATAIEVQVDDETSTIPAVVTPFDRHIADAVIAAGWEKPRVITGISELNVLSEDAVLECGSRRLWPGEPAGLEWAMAGDPVGHTVHEIALPTRVMFAAEARQ